MSSTVTSTVTTISSAASISVTTALGLAAVLLLLACIVTKEMASSGANPRLAVLNRALNVPIAPLFIAFATIASAKVIAIL